MKKLMIALSAVAIAAVSNAATVNWNSGTMYAAVKADGTSGSAAGVLVPGTADKKYGATGYKGTAYLFYFDALDAYNTAKATDVSKLYETYILDSAKVATAVTTKAPTAGGAANIKLEGQPDGTAQNPITLYGMVLYVDTDTAATRGFSDVDVFVKAGFGTAQYADAAGVSFTDIGLQQANWTAYSAVPEPTSGLLLLLGVAGLALRRRRA